MNVIKTENEKIKKKMLIVYTIIGLLCVVAIIVVVLIQVLGNDMANQVLGVNYFSQKTEEQEEILKTEFEDLFQNKIEGNLDVINVSKLDEQKDIIYTGFEGQKKVNNSYDIKVSIPYFNIDNEIIQNYNKEIEQTFKQKVYTTLETENQNIIYTVDYQASIQDSILSVMIRSYLKEGASAQREIIQTYHYDLQNNKEITLKDVISQFGLNENKVQDKIRTEIKKEQKKANDLQDLGYTIFSRDVNNEMYTIENTTEFFIRNQNLYLIYAYGNDSFTSEKDLVIL